MKVVLNSLTVIKWVQTVWCLPYVWFEVTKKERSHFCTSHNSEAQNHFNLGLGPKISNNSNLAGQKNLHTIPYKVSSFNNVITVDKTNFIFWIQIVNFSPSRITDMYCL